MTSVQPEVLDKILKFAAQLNVYDGLTLAATVTPVVGTMLGTAWAHGRSSGRTYEVMHGQVPHLRTELDSTRFQVLALKGQLEGRDDQIRVLKETATTSGISPKLPIDVQSVLSLRQELVKDDAEIWRLREPEPLPHLSERLIASGLSVITVGNLKGGVGKTTVTANLAGYFAQRLRPSGKRVLVVDLDYQGSLTATLLQASQKRIDRSATEYILSGQANGDWLSKVIKEVDAALPGVDLVPSGYTLAAAEDQLMMRWLLHTTDRDIRFNLAEFLLSPQVQQTYKVVLLDVGPRLTTASISALCASTHLLVPTNLDRLSAETIGSLLNRVSSIKQSLGLPIKLAGILGTMTFRDKLSGPEEDALGTIRDGLREWEGEGYVFDRTIPRKQILANVAGTDIGYRRNAAIRSLFNTLGNELAGRIGL